MWANCTIFTEFEAEAAPEKQKAPANALWLAGANPKSYATNQSSPGFSSSSFFFARVTRAFEIAF